MGRAAMKRVITYGPIHFKSVIQWGLNVPYVQNNFEENSSLRTWIQNCKLKKWLKWYLKTFRLSRHGFHITIVTKYCLQKDKCGGIGIYTCNSLTIGIVNDDIKLVIACDRVKCEIKNSVFNHFNNDKITVIAGYEHRYYKIFRWK